MISEQRNISPLPLIQFLQFWTVLRDPDKLSGIPDKTTRKESIETVASHNELKIGDSP